MGALAKFGTFEQVEGETSEVGSSKQEVADLEAGRWGLASEGANGVMEAGAAGPILEDLEEAAPFLKKGQKADFAEGERRSKVLIG